MFVIYLISTERNEVHMNFIVVVDKQWNIGCGGKLLTHIPEDLKFFKKITLNKVVVMGRKTFESLPGKRPLEGRINVILTKDRNFKAEGTIICHSMEELFETLKAYPSEDVFIIGGGAIYEQLIPYCNKGYVTKIDDEFRGDTRIRNLDIMEEWKLMDEGPWIKSVKGAVIRFTIYKKIGS